MKFLDNDSIVLINDFKSEKLQKGSIGTVVMVYTNPIEAYEVEFVNNDGEVVAQIVLLPNEMKKYNK